MLKDMNSAAFLRVLQTMGRKTCFFSMEMLTLILAVKYRLQGIIIIEM